LHFAFAQDFLQNFIAWGIGAEGFGEFCRGGGLGF
jgi:hypothetical protein